MSEQLTRYQQPYTPNEVVQQLLKQHSLAVPPPNLEVALRRRVAALERQAPEYVQAARREGVAIEHLGEAPLPGAPMLYHGTDGAGWVMGPATVPEDTIVPKQQGRELTLIRQAGVLLPQIYVAHELRPGQADRIRAQVTGRGLELDAATAAELVGPNPPPPQAVSRGERMAQHSQQIVDGLQLAGKVAAVVVVGAITIPVAAAAAVLAAPAMMVDPIILGAIPAASEQAGQPASWYRLVSWDW